MKNYCEKRRKSLYKKEKLYTIKLAQSITRDIINTLRRRGIGDGFFWEVFFAYAISYGNGQSARKDSS